MDQQARTGPWLWLGPVLYMLVVGMYFISRYGGLWADSDTASFTQYIRAVAQEGRLEPLQSGVYPNGYAYQAISTVVVALTGLDVAILQQIVYPLLASLLVLLAWTTYRELTGNTRGATLATILLFTQPEFLFVILRSSHEKFTRGLMLLCLFWLARSFKLREQPWHFALHVGLFYLTTFAFIASNNLLAHSFIFAVALALILGWLLQKRNAHLQAQNAGVLRRLPYATVICLGLVYIFTFHAYLPAQHDLLVLQNIWERIAALLLDVQTLSTNAYAQVEAGWVNLYVYFLLSVANWIILLSSFVIWIHQGWHWLWRGQTPEVSAAWLLWLFYAAFAAQGAISALADASGVLSSNLQHRIFPSFSIVAVALVGSALASWRPRRLVRPLQLGLAASIFCIALLSVLKAANEPILSNKWTFYRSNELIALEWSDTHLQATNVWSEFDERLSVAFAISRGKSTNNNYFSGGNMKAITRNVLITTITRLRSSRLGKSLPTPHDALHVYDNGESDLYHFRPLTPYQR